MTVPTAHDYPDWAPQYEAVDLELISDINHTINGPVSYPQFYMGNRRRVGISFTNLSARAQIGILAFRDSAGTQQLTSNLFVLNNGMSFERSIAVSAVWLGLRITPVGAGPLTYDLRAWTTEVPYQQFGSLTDSLLQSSEGQAIGAGAIVVNTSVAHYVGEVYWNAWCSGPNWIAQLQIVDLAGATHTVDKTTNVEGRAARRAYLPYGYSRIRVTNNDVAAQTFDGILCAYPDPGH